jgi:prophage antirepressor-like protein
LNDLITFDRAFFVGCIKSQRSAIQNKNIPDDQYWFATYNKRTNMWSSAIPENRKAKVLISKEWAHNNLPRLTGDQHHYKYKPLPPLLELSEDEKFRDETGNIHEVELRGDKSKDGIRFKCKDIARVFEMDSIDHHIQRMLDSSEYDIFCSDNPTNWVGLSEQNTGGKPTSTYLTYNGLLKIIFASRSGTAYRFQDWATEIIYSAHLGTTEERLDVAASVIDTDVESMRLYFEEQLRLKEEQYQQRENQYQQQLDEQQDYISILKDISVSDNQRNCIEIIYIATCDSYARRNRFKIGGVQSSEKLQQRLSTYNTRSANGDMFFYSDIFMVADYHHAESRIKDLIGRFVDKKGKEFYQLHYTELREIVKYICERYTEEVEKINEGLSRLVASLNVQRLRPVVPRPVNHASYVNVVDGVPHNKVITNPDEDEFRSQVRTYLSGLLYPVTTIHRRDIFDNIGLRVNKSVAWKWIKQEVGDYDPELLNKLQYR